jgi:hypothetical protein
VLSGLTPKTWRVIGYVRDAVVILAIVVGGMYILSHPEKVDAFLNWVLGRIDKQAINRGIRRRRSARTLPSISKNALNGCGAKAHPVGCVACRLRREGSTSRRLSVLLGGKVSAVRWNIAANIVIA